MTKNPVSKNEFDCFLATNQVHLWKIDIGYPGMDVESLYKKILSSDERERVDRLRSEDDKKRFIIARGQLREKLSSYLKVSPSDIAFSYNKYGKPNIKSDHNLENIKFNVSHSKNLIVFAITQNREVGIDLEYIRKVNNIDKIVHRYFGAEENKFYDSVPETKKELAFFTLWTRKEAYSKARGMGIGLPGKKFDLNLSPIFQSNMKKNTESDWSLIDIEINSDYLAALAAEGKDLEICHYTMDTSF